MFRSETIYHVDFMIQSNTRERIITNLHDIGICEIIMEESETDYSKFQTIKTTIKKLITILGKYKHKKSKTQILSLSNSKIDINPIEKHTTKISTKVNDILNKNANYEKQFQKNTILINDLNNITQSEAKIFTESPKLTWNILIIPTDKIKELLENKNYTKTTLTHYKIINKDESILYELQHKTDKSEYSEIAKRTIVFPKHTKATNYISKLRKENVELKASIQKNKTKLNNISQRQLQTLKAYNEEITLFLEHSKATEQIANLSSFSKGTVWLPKKNISNFEKILKTESPSYIMECIEKETAPTLLKNNFLVKPFENITKLYSLPKYKKFDPTIIIAFFFPIIFGIMLTDFFYGMIMIAVGIAMLNMKKFKEDELIPHMIITCGIVTAIAGMVFGSYFGNLFENTNIPYALNTMKDIIPMIIMSITIGLLHISIGLIIGFIENIKNKKIFTALKEQGVWIIFIMGLLCLLPQTHNFKIISYTLIAISIMMQFILNFKENGLINGILSVFNFSNFFGDLFSYVRIMALAIGTSGVALAVNFMVQISNDYIPYFGLILAIIIFIIGHTFNLAMNGLGAFIHTLRLHFLEHFSRYYQGDGTEYMPFKAKRKYTKKIYNLKGEQI